MLGLGLVGSLGVHAGEKNPIPKAEQMNPTPISTPEIKTDYANNAEVVNFAADQHEQILIQKLEQRKARLELELQNLTGKLEGQKADFSQRYEEVMAFLGKEIPKGKGRKGNASLINFPAMLADSAMNAGREHVAGRADITSKDNVSGLAGMLLAEDGFLGKEVATLNGLLSGPMGATTHQREANVQTGDKLDATNPPDIKRLMEQKATHLKYGVTVGGFNEDLDQHGALGNLPKSIVETSLQIVKAQYQLDGTNKELEKLLNIPGAPAHEITAQN